MVRLFWWNRIPPWSLQIQEFLSSAELTGIQFLLLHGRKMENLFPILDSQQKLWLTDYPPFELNPFYSRIPILRYPAQQTTELEVPSKPRLSSQSSRKISYLLGTRLSKLTRSWSRWNKEEQLTSLARSKETLVPKYSGWGTWCPLTSEATPGTPCLL